jgi:hypothetical protein
VNHPEGYPWRRLITDAGWLNVAEGDNARLSSDSRRRMRHDDGMRTVSLRRRVVGTGVVVVVIDTDPGLGAAVDPGEVAPPKDHHPVAGDLAGPREEDG